MGPAAGTVKRTVRVTHVVFDFDGGGLESLVAAMAERTRGTDVVTSLVTLGGRVGRLGASTRHTFDRFVVARPLPAFSMLYPRGLAREIRDTRPDVVHVHSGCWFKGAKAARLAGVPRVIYTEHGREHDDPLVQRWLDRRAAASTDVVVAVSNRLSDYLVQTVGIEATKVRVIHNGVDTERFVPGEAPAAMRAALGIAPEAAVIGSVGRLEWVKAYDRLVEAAPMLRSRLRGRFAIVVCGEGSQRQALEARAKELGVDDLVRFPGWTDRSDQFYRLLDVFVLCSRSEGESVSLMEAMAAGALPVVTDVGANAEIVGPQLSAQVLPDETPQSLALGIAAALSGPQRHAEFAAAARRRAVESYGLARMISEYERLYRSAGAAL